MSYDELVALAKELDRTPDHLDDTVHDTASSYASSINNAGVERQIAFLLDQCGEDDVEAMIRGE